MLMTPVSFGTSGHRGIIGSGFTIAHVSAITMAICEHLKTLSPSPSLLVGYDPRTGNDPLLGSNSFTQQIASVCHANGVRVVVCESYIPTPVISWAIPHFHFDGGVILTASHNPPEYNGIKFNPRNGAPAPLEVTTFIQTRANELLHSPLPTVSAYQPERISLVDGFSDALLSTLSKTVSTPITDTFFSSMRCVVDTVHGTTGPTWRAIAERTGLGLTLLHESPDPLFGGLEPNPTKPDILESLRQSMQTHQASFGFAHDPDGDRHLILDELGHALSPEETAVIILDFLHARGDSLRGIATTVASSQLVSSANSALGYESVQTAVGFKYFSDFLVECRHRLQLGLAVESSGGFSISSHTLEKCGFLPCVLVLAICRETGLTLSALRQQVLDRYGRFYFSEREFRCSDASKTGLLAALDGLTATEASTIFQHPCESISRVDGVKFLFESGWVLIRASGTEPVFRCYAEFSEQVTSDALSVRAIEWLKSAS